MNVSCLKENLAKSLAIVNHAVSSRAAMPITTHVLINAKGGFLQLTATNLEISITTWVPAIIQDEGDTTVPARLLTDFVSSLPQDRIDLNMEAESSILNLSCLKSQAHIHTMKAGDFPPIPQLEEAVSASIDPEELRKAINRVAFAAATEESRPILTGVKLSSDGDQYTMAAADGFRLAVHTGSLANTPETPLDAVIPASALIRVGRLLGDQKTPVEVMMAAEQRQVMFKMDNTQLVSQLLQGTFPDYSQLIPKHWDTRAVFSHDDLLRATKTAAIFARDGSNIVRMHVEPANQEEGAEHPRAIISSKSEEVGDNQDEILAESMEGSPCKIAYNHRYLSEAINAMDKSKVVMETTTPSSPGVFRPVGSDTYTMVVMPMFVQW